MLNGMGWRGWREGLEGSLHHQGTWAWPELSQFYIALSYKQTFIYRNSCVPGHLRFSLLGAHPAQRAGGSSTGLSAQVIPLVLDPGVQVLSPPLAPKPCRGSALLWARCPRMGSAARCLQSLSSYQQLPLVGGWKGSASDASLAWFPL